MTPLDIAGSNQTDALVDIKDLAALPESTRLIVGIECRTISTRLIVGIECRTITMLVQLLHTKHLTV